MSCKHLSPSRDRFHCIVFMCLLLLITFQINSIGVSDFIVAGFQSWCTFLDVGHGSHPVTEPKGIIISTACHIGPVHGTQDFFEFDKSIHILYQHMYKIRKAVAMELISLQIPMFHGNQKMILRKRRRNINPNKRAPISWLGGWCVG